MHSFRQNTIWFIEIGVLISETLHSVCFARTSLTVSKYSGMISIYNRIDQLINFTCFVYLFLGCSFWKNMIKSKFMRLFTCKIFDYDPPSYTLPILVNQCECYYNLIVSPLPTRVEFLQQLLFFINSFIYNH